MIVESKSVRDLLGTVKQSQFTHHTEKCKAEEEPESYRTPMNPIPALVVFLLGKMMSSHHQESMVSTMIHAQWGALLMGSALARLATYMLTFLSPPTSVLPGRPPTELLTGFCLMAGGIIFMTSASCLLFRVDLANGSRLAILSPQSKTMASMRFSSSPSQWES